ncbi:hypothetical protein B7P43_G00885 [Cryptotermes secundus]|nr:uncharacterized protein LOC111873383 [Cryptotermes secundus]PNF16766.1 hypothetical protein B7P43_G00885 [Cryptotermes secundus]PNF16768.1 hypothetical protein B7P43_G00885 [Cryptotermes secundus]
MVGMWTPEPSREPYDENLSTAEVGMVVAEQDSSDSEDENLVYGGYELLSQVPTDLPSSGIEDVDDSVSAGDLPESSKIDGMVTAAVDIEDNGASQMVSYQCSFENERRSELREVWSGSSHGDSIEMGSEQAERVRAAMANFSLPASAIPSWASAVPEEQWKQQLLDRIQRQQQQQGDGQPKI